MKRFVCFNLIWNSNESDYIIGKFRKELQAFLDDFEKKNAVVLIGGHPETFNTLKSISKPTTSRSDY